jgi:hypothetical protein
MPILNLKVTRSGSLNRLDIFLKTVEKSFSSEVLKRDLKNIEKHVLSVAENTINQNRKRDLKRHTRLITVLKQSTSIEQLSKNRFRLGIGAKGYLQNNAPYWYVLNYGHTVNSSAPYRPPKMLGYFGRGNKPLRGVSNEIFHASLSNPYPKSPYGGGKVWQLKPAKPITPIHYLQAMALTFQKDIDELVIAYKRRMKEAVKRAKQISKKEVITLTERQIDLLESKGINTSAYSERTLFNMLKYFSK